MIRDGWIPLGGVDLDYSSRENVMLKCSLGDDMFQQ